MKNLIAGLLILASLSVATFAVAEGKRGDCDHGHHGKHGIVSKLERLIDLTDQQREQLAALELDKPQKQERVNIHKQLMELDASSANYNVMVNDLAEQAAQRAAERARQKVLHKAKVHAEVSAILTDEQIAELKALHAEKRAMHKKWHGDKE